MGTSTRLGGLIGQLPSGRLFKEIEHVSPPCWSHDKIQTTRCSNVSSSTSKVWKWSKSVVVWVKSDTKSEIFTLVMLFIHREVFKEQSHKPFSTPAQNSSAQNKMQLQYKRVWSLWKGCMSFWVMYDISHIVSYSTRCSSLLWKAASWANIQKAEPFISKWITVITDVNKGNQGVTCGDLFSF